MASILPNRIKNKIMNKLFLFLVFSSLSFISIAQTGGTIPAVSVKTIDGKNFNTADIKNDGKPIFY